MSYLIGILVLAALMGASAAAVLIALARLVELLPAAPVSGEDEEGPAGSELLR
jgi:hypothetical protein